MGIGDNFKDKKLIIIIAAAITALIAVVIVLLPSNNKKFEPQPEVISKRAKIGAEGPGAPAQAEPAKMEDQAPKAPDKKPVEDARPAIKVELPQKEALPAAAPIEKKPEPQKKEAPQSASEKPAASKKVFAQETKHAEPQPKAVKGTEQTAGKSKGKDQETEKPRKDRQKFANPAWAVNVASYPGSDEAIKLAASLKAAGYHSYITDFKKDDVIWHRVRVGFFATRDAAEAASRRIKKKYRVKSGWIVRPTRQEVQLYNK